MASPTLPVPGVAPGVRRTGALLALTMGAILLVGCGASLQDELASGIGQQQVAGPAAAEQVAASAGGAAVTTASTAALDSGDMEPGDPGDVAGPDGSSVTGVAPGAIGTPPVRKAAVSGPADVAAATPAAVHLPPSAASLTSVAEPGHKAYRIGPLDVLTITVFRVPELSTTVQVADTGTINLPLIGEVPSSGRTAQEIEQDVTARLGEKYLQNPQVTVFIKEYNARRVTVDGSVRKPGVYPLRGRTTLLQTITLAEGLDNNRASGEVVVFRQVDGKRTAARFDLDDIRKGTAKDPIVEPGDVVIVDDSTAKVVLHNVLRVLPVTNVFMGVF